VSDTVVGAFFPSNSSRILVADWASWVALLMVFAIGAWTAGHWFWKFSVKSTALSVSAIAVPPLALSRELAAQHRFGASQPLPPATSADPSGLVLIGVVAAKSGKGGLAIFLVDGKKQIASVVGNEVVPGLMLVGVANDHAELSRDGRLTKIPLSRRK